MLRLVLGFLLLVCWEGHLLLGAVAVFWDGVVGEGIFVGGLVEEERHIFRFSTTPWDCRRSIVNKLLFASRRIAITLQSFLLKWLALIDVLILVNLCKFLHFLGVLEELQILFLTDSMLKHMLLVLMLLCHVLLDQLLRQDDMRQVSDQVCVYTHLDQRGLSRQHINDLDAHGLNIQRCILAQIEQYLESFHLVELATNSHSGVARSL